MDEAGARAVMERIVGTEEPPTRIDVALARRTGYNRLRWRLAAIAGAVPVIAVAAVLVAGALPLGAARHRPAPVPETRSAPHRFSPVVPYATFGWLPPGKHVTTAYTSAAVQQLEAGPTGSSQSWNLIVYSDGSCNYTSGQVLGLLRGGHRPTLKCSLNWGAGGVIPMLANPVSAIAPSVNGRRAFWARPVCDTHQCDLSRAMIVWSYASGGWAWLRGPSRGDALKVAGRVTFGATTTQAIRFPVRVIGARPSWRVLDVQSAPSDRVLTAQQWDLGTAASSEQPAGVTAVSFTVQPRGLGKASGTCQLQPPSAARHRIINGFRVTTAITAQVAQICAPDVRGMSVYISTAANVTPDAIAIFAHHLRLLGASPAAWTTRPLG